jgi:hypothetical protein
MGVTFFGDEAPDEFGKFDRALITMYRLTAGDTWVRPVSRAQPEGWGGAIMPMMLVFENGGQLKLM